ncbi:MAG: hypothetical protein Q4A74_01625 [Cardiobacteriaceae bacterium]|nr:hypothetical protein [Cardiobacteriaceae bacterium]
MIIDSLLRFSEAQAADGESTNTIDFKVKDPNLGMVDKKMWVVVTGKEGFAAGDTMDVEIQHSEAETSGFSTVAQSGAQPFGVGKIIAMPLPLIHKRYLRLKYTKTGTGGKVDAQLVDGLQMAIIHPENPKVNR